jgi:hypothetical protein
MTVVKRPKAQVCSRLISGTEVSNPAEGMDICHLWVLCVVRVAASATVWSLLQKSLTLSVLTVCDLETSKRDGIRPSWADAPHKKNYVMLMKMWAGILPVFRND